MAIDLRDENFENFDDVENWISAAVEIISTRGIFNDMVFVFIVSSVFGMGL